jgi:hypothetical protein
MIDLTASQAIIGAISQAAAAWLRRFSDIAVTEMTPP